MSDFGSRFWRQPSIRTSTVNSLKGELTVIDAPTVRELTKIDAEVDGELTLPIQWLRITREPIHKTVGSAR